MPAQQKMAATTVTKDHPEAILWVDPLDPLLSDAWVQVSQEPALADNHEK